MTKLYPREISLSQLIQLLHFPLNCYFSHFDSYIPERRLLSLTVGHSRFAVGSARVRRWLSGVSPQVLRSITLINKYQNFRSGNINISSVKLQPAASSIVMIRFFVSRSASFFVAVLPYSLSKVVVIRSGTLVIMILLEYFSLHYI